MIIESLMPIVGVLITQAGLFMMMLITQKNKVNEKYVENVEKVQNQHYNEMKALEAKIEMLRERLEICDREKAGVSLRLSVLEDYNRRGKQ